MGAPARSVSANIHPSEPFELWGIARESMPWARCSSIQSHSSSGLFLASSRLNGMPGTFESRKMTFRCRFSPLGPPAVNS